MDDDQESVEFKGPYLEERFADGGDSGHEDGLTSCAGCLLVSLLVLGVLGAVAFGVTYIVGS